MTFLKWNVSFQKYRFISFWHLYNETLTFSFKSSIFTLKIDLHCSNSMKLRKNNFRTLWAEQKFFRKIYMYPTFLAIYFPYLYSFIIVAAIIVIHEVLRVFILRFSFFPLFCTEKNEIFVPCCIVIWFEILLGNFLVVLFRGFGVFVLTYCSLLLTYSKAAKTWCSNLRMVLQQKTIGSTV